MKTGLVTMQILEGIARGEKAIHEGRVLSHEQAKKRMKRYILKERDVFD